MDVELAGVGFHALTEEEAVARVREGLARGEGGRILTPNVDILRQAPTEYAADATLVVADGMPLVWASRLAGTPLPERVAGSSLIWSLSRALAMDGRSAFLLGGQPPGGWARAADALRATCPRLRVPASARPSGSTRRRPASHGYGMLWRRQHPTWCSS